MNEVTNLYDKKIPKVDSNHKCLAVISLDSALKKDGNNYLQVFLKKCKCIQKKLFGIYLIILFDNNNNNNNNNNDNSIYLKITWYLLNNDYLSDFSSDESGERWMLFDKLLSWLLYSGYY